jgi:5'-deoxynucleotidase YfbR-like HD superfamily hydrolase
MSLTKTILRDFVNKVKEKAVKAVEEKNKQIMEEAIKEYFALHPEEKATFDRMQALVEELAKTATDLAVFVEDWTQINNYPHNLGLSNYFSGCLNYSGSSK